MIGINELKNKLRLCNMKYLLVLVSNDNRFYLCFDAPKVKKEKRDWYSLSLNPFEENAYKLVPTEPITELGNQYQYPLYGKFAIANDKKSSMLDNTDLLTEIYFGVNGEQVTLSKLAERYNKSTASISQVRNKLAFLFRRVLLEYLEPFNENKYSVEYIREFYDNWVQIVTILNNKLPINDKFTFDALEYLHDHSLYTFDKFEADFRCYRVKGVEPVKGMTKDIMDRVFIDTKSERYRNIKMKLTEFLNAIYYYDSDNTLDLLEFYPE